MILLFQPTPTLPESQPKPERLDHDFSETDVNTVAYFI
jgi:hypothetical protein